ncbi:hypothetical protein KEJ14_04790 [Candidatus Bathyarchaeota archaeon]|nr:hypothetical protein [Candidatus Bathyarchaeota archaeon]
MAEMNSRRNSFPFLNKYSSISDILGDHELASLGDAFVNLIYSLALSKAAGRPVGRKLDSRVLSSALRKAGLRSLLPHRMDRHKLADAAEALIVYGWLSGVISLEEALNMVSREGDLSDNICSLLKLVWERVGLALRGY